VSGTKKARKFKLHFGSGVVAEEARIEGEHHSPAIQLLDFTEGEAAGTSLVRFCFYNQRGSFMRDPLLLGEPEIADLREALRETPRLREMLRGLVSD
jgi:hypothetical protein